MNRDEYFIVVLILLTALTVLGATDWITRLFPEIGLPAYLPWPIAPIVAITSAGLMILVCLGWMSGRVE